MATVPPERTTTGGTPEPTVGSLGMRGGPAGIPIPMNPEFLVYLLIWVVIILSWLISDRVGINEFLTYTVALTFGYLISRGIAKASRVYE